MKKLVSVKWLFEHLFDDNLFVLDASLNLSVVRGQGDKTIPNSIHFDINNDFSDESNPFPHMLPKVEKFEREARRLGINNNSKIVVFDNNGIYASPRVWWMFKVMGHNDITVLNGGLPKWIEKGYLVVERERSQNKIGNFKANIKSNLVVSYRDILLNIKNRKFILVDARSSGRFNGLDKEPRNHLKSGHIPNSINIPYEDVLENGKFKSELELKALFSYKCKQESDLVFSCGSGVTACIIMLACEIGFKESRRLYDGSWSEWAEFQDLKIELCE